MVGRDPGEDSYPSRHDALGYNDDEVFLGAVVRSLWPYRQVVGGALVILMLLYVAVSLTAYLWIPSERLTTLTFRVLFDGAERGEYPNGMTFSTADIVAMPVLTDVFAANELDRYLSFESFESSVFVLDANPEIERLSYEYQAKLANTALSVVDRARIEAEFDGKLASLTAAVFSLNLRERASGASVPQSIKAKLLEDTLATWARYADERRGALMYDVPPYSTNALRWQLLESEDYLIRVDILRLKVVQIVANIDELLELPGARVMRVGDDQVSLTDVRLQLEDILRFDLRPLAGLIRATGVSNDSEVLSLYFRDQLTQLKFDRQETIQRLTTLQNALNDYMGQRSTPVLGEAGTAPATTGNQQTLIPQFGESFLDRLLDMSTQQVDIEYRQGLTNEVIEGGYAVAALDREVSYYEDLGAARRESGSSRGNREQIMSSIEARTRAAFDEITLAIGQIGAIYEELSTFNLNPSSLLYETTAPVRSWVERSLSLRDVAIRGVVFFVLGLFLVTFGCLTHGYFRREITQG